MGNQLLQKEMILNDAFNIWWNSRYKELIASGLIKKWETVDTFCQIAIALTAVGSGIAGWHLWELPQMKIVWSVISGMIALVAICHKWFHVVDKVKIWSDTRTAFKMIKNNLETLRYQVDISFEKNYENIHKMYLNIRENYTNEDNRTPDNDFLLFRSLENTTVWNIYNSNEKTNFEEELKLSKEKYKYEKD